MISNSTNIINPKPCNYDCDTRIYWDTFSNSYLEVFTKQKHICKIDLEENQILIIIINIAFFYGYRINQPNSNGSRIRGRRLCYWLCSERGFLLKYQNFLVNSFRITKSG